MRESDWKLIEHYEDGSIELFNLKDDPSEKIDRSKDERHRVEKMRSQLHQWLHSVQAQTNSPNPRFDSALHRAIYKDYDIGRYDPSTATKEEFTRVLEWRRLMNRAIQAAP